ncbi:TY2B-GR1, partial [Symbiodinium necroappetens]
VYGTGGRYDLDSRWKAGQYVGPSLEVRGGHVIRFDNGAFMTSTHLRPYLVDSDQIVDLEEYEVRLPNPERRLRTKTKEAAVERDCQEVNTTVDPDHPAELYAKDLLEEEILYAEQMETLAMMLPTTTATPKRFGPQAQTQKVWMAGAFVHGGIAGVKNATTSFSYSTRALVRYVKQLEPTHKFNSLAVTVDTEAKQHVDAHNVGMNLIAGLLLELDGANTHQVFNPKYRHSTRIGAIKVGLLETSSHAVAPEQPRDSSDQVGEGFDLDAVAPEQPRDSSDQVGEGFDLDAVAPEQHRDSPDQVGDVLHEDQFRKWGDTDVLSHLSQDLEVAIQDLEDRAARLRDLLEEEEILNEEYRRLGDSTRAYLMDARDQVGVFLDNVHEELVQAERVKSAMCLCVMKAGQDPTPEEEIDYELLLDGLEEDLKVVHTVPTPQVRRALDRWTAAIRKEVEALFASGTLRRATIEEARSLEAEHKVTFAPAKCIFTLKPPQTPGQRARRKCRLVICGNYIRDNSDFGDLYAAGTSTDSLRLSLVLAAIGVGGRYQLKTARVRCGDLILILRPTISESELWMILDEVTGVLYGLVVLYVDDIAYFSTTEIIEALHTFVTEAWPASPLEWIGDGSPARYLGMEIRREPRTTSEGTAFFVYTIGQGAYVQDLLRGHDMESVTPTALPVPREWVEEAENDDSVESDIEEATLKQAQRVVGEMLWLSTRTRPDLSFVVGHAASLVAKRPSYVTRLGQRLMSYLAGTKDLRMTMGPTTPTATPELVAFTDASYVWPGLQRVLAVDNTSAASMLSGGAVQLADLATKMQPRLGRASLALFDDVLGSCARKLEEVSKLAKKVAKQEIAKEECYDTEEDRDACYLVLKAFDTPAGGGVYRGLDCGWKVRILVA